MQKQKINSQVACTIYTNTTYALPCLNTSVSFLSSQTNLKDKLKFVLPVECASPGGFGCQHLNHNTTNAPHIALASVANVGPRLVNLAPTHDLGGHKSHCPLHLLKFPGPRSVGGQPGSCSKVGYSKSTASGVN